MQDIRDIQEMQGATDIITDHMSIQVENSSVELDEQVILLANRLIILTWLAQNSVCCSSEDFFFFFFMYI